MTMVGRGLSSWLVNHGFARLGSDFFNTTTPQPKRLRHDIPRGNTRVMTKRFYTGTNTDDGIVAEGWDVVVVDYGCHGVEEASSSAVVLPHRRPDFGFSIKGESRD